MLILPPLLLHPFNGLFSRTTWVSRYQKGETSLDLNEARDGGVLGRTGISWTICKQICTSLQTDNYTNTSSFNFYRADALPGAQPTVSKHRRHSLTADNKGDITGNSHYRMCSVQSCKAGYASDVSSQKNTMSCTGATVKRSVKITFRCPLIPFYHILYM